MQDPFATKEVYRDGPFAQLMIGIFSRKMSKLLGGGPLEIELAGGLVCSPSICSQALLRAPLTATSVRMACTFTSALGAQEPEGPAVQAGSTGAATTALSSCPTRW